MRFCGTVQRQTDTASKAPVLCGSPCYRIEFRQGSLGRDHELKQRRLLRAHAATLLAVHAAATRDQESWDALSDGRQSRLLLRAGRDGSFVSKYPDQPTPYSRGLALFGRRRTTDRAFTKVCGVEAGTRRDWFVSEQRTRSHPLGWLVSFARLPDWTLNESAEVYWQIRSSSITSFCAFGRAARSS